MNTLIKRFSLVATSSILFSGMLAGLLSAVAQAATLTGEATAKVTFSFDDGLTSAYTQVAPTLAKYGLKGTDYVATSCVGMTTAPNTCHANTAASYMSWTQIKALKSTYGWEIGSHTATHPYLATSDASDGQPLVLTPAQVTKELADSKAALAAQGIDAQAFSTPYGDYNNSTLASIAKYYGSHRGFADTRDGVWPYNDYLLNTMQVQVPVTVATVQAKIDYAIAHKQWLILTLHDVLPTPSKNTDDYQYATKDLEAIAAYVKTKKDAGLIQNVNITEGLVSGTNLLTNSSFNSGIASGWTTDSATAITLDSATNGSYPDAAKSIKLTPGTTAAHLFSPRVSVNTTSTYMLKSFLNVQALKSGEVGYYIDEYDANGNWISGQWKTAEKSSFVEEMNFTYTPSSIRVSTASLQVYATANSGITAYVDNFQWFETSRTAPASLLPNGGFTSGIAAGWTTDDAANIVADKANHGGSSTPADSVSLTANTAKTTHLFSPKASVSAAKSYSVQSYLNITALKSGEVAYYVDEYDQNGAWISGQYKTGIAATGIRQVGFTYTPSSTNVTSMNLQIIVVGNSGIKAYIDDISLWAN